jgi:DNA-directed RNA polymerase specialized sigma24 family protein
VSLDAPSEDDETFSLHDLVADLSVNVEAEVMGSVILGLLPIAINSLSELLHEAIMLKYFKYPDLSDRQIAELICIEEKAFVKRKERALKKLLDFFKK